jgi:multisubunit Na+/H+ antiporter MnhE subunit
VREIGWFHFCLGHISTKWSSAFHHNSHPPTSASVHWSSLLIIALWRFSWSLWKFRNEVVHGATIEDQVRRRIFSLHQQIATHYAEFTASNSYVLPTTAYLPLGQKTSAKPHLTSPWQHGYARLKRRGRFFSIMIIPYATHLKSSFLTVHTQRAHLIWIPPTHHRMLLP